MTLGLAGMTTIGLAQDNRVQVDQAVAVQKAWEILDTTLRTGTPPERSAALNALAGAQTPRAKAALARLAGDGSYAARSSAFWFLPSDAAYLPIVIQDAAGVPLDPSFAEQKSIMLRCKGVFYACNKGIEARRFNRLLIDAGLIKGL